MFGRDTSWRQGCILSTQSARSLNLINSEDGSERVVVISHDCDLLSEKEQTVEIIVCTVASSINSQLCNAKNPRCLHLHYDHQDGGALILELKHSSRKELDKELFFSTADREEKIILSPDGKSILKQWLAARYGRPAFPNMLERRLRKKHKGKSVEAHIAGITTPCAHFLLGLFFDLGEHRHTELNENEPYYLSIFVVYNSESGGQAARLAAEKAAAEILNLFQCTYGMPELATEILIENCAAVADSMISLAEIRKIDQWRLEYISLGDEPVGVFLPVGT